MCTLNIREKQDSTAVLGFPICNNVMTEKIARTGRKMNKKTNTELQSLYAKKNPKQNKKQTNKRTLNIQMNIEISLSAGGFSAPCCFTITKTRLRCSDLNSCGNSEFPKHSVLGSENLSEFHQDEPCKMSKPSSSVYLLAIDKGV